MSIQNFTCGNYDSGDIALSRLVVFNLEYAKTSYGVRENNLRGM
jgi:hypothetical protein